MPRRTRQWVGALGPQFYRGAIVRAQQILFTIVPRDKAAAE